MNTNRSFRFAIVFALAAILLNTFAVWAYPAEGPETAPAMQCEQVLATAVEVAAGIDFPSRRVEYAALDRIANCMKVAGIHTVLPVTGSDAEKDDTFLTIKDHQAEQMDQSPLWARLYPDQRWMDFKDRQAERMDQ